jgi:hypothetical protein
MTELQASRTLVKSPPELWAECSDAASLARHLDRFGEIRITRLEPETAVAWEGERARGTVRIEPAGWGTKVILTAVAEGVDPESPVDVADAPPEREPPVEAVSPEPEPEPAIIEALSEPPLDEPPVDEAPVEEPPAEELPPPARKRRFGRLRAFWRGPEPLPAVEEPLVTEAPPPVLEAPQPVTEAPPPVTEAPPPVTEAPPPVHEAPPPVLEAPPPVTEAPVPVVSETEAALTAALDSLGQAHHRPYSRA